MRTGPLLVSDHVDRYQPLGAFGQPVYLSWVQLRATIAQKLGKRHADYFARPDRDPNGRMVHWVAEVPGAVQRWVDLAPDEQARVALDLEAIRSEFLRYLGELRTQAGDASDEAKGATTFASLLEQAMQVPDDTHLHIVGDQPVVSFWGFRGADGRSVDPLASAPARPSDPPAGPRAAAGPDGGGTGAGGPTLAGPALAAAPQPWWRRWLWPLLGLLLLLLFLFLLAWCMGDEVRVPEGYPPGGHTSVADGTASRTASGDGGFVDRTLRYFGLGEGGAGDVALDRPPAVPPADTVMPGAATETLSGKPPAGLGDQADAPKPDGASPPPAAGEEQPKPPKPDEPKAPAPDERNPDVTTPTPDSPGPTSPSKEQDQQADQTGQPASPPPSPPKPAAADKGQPLQIPPDAAAGKDKNLGFVGGEWRSDAGLVDQTTNQPLQQTYRFDDTGKGEVVIRRADGVECRAAAQATMQGGRLGIEESGRPTCPDGRSYTPSRTECVRTPSGQTVCQGHNDDGSTYRVGIERAAPQP